MADDSSRRLTEREEARERLKASVNVLAERANLQVQMQKEPLKMLGGASAVGTLLGVVVGRQFRRSRKIYVDAASPAKHQKALIKAQQKQKGKRSVGGALVATLGTLAFKVLNDKVITPRLEEIANGMLDRSGQAPAQTKGAPPQAQAKKPGLSLPTRPASGGKPVGSGGTSSFLKREGGDPGPDTGTPPVTVTAGQSKAPQATGAQGTVEAKAQGSVIAPQEKANPNL